MKTGDIVKLKNGGAVMTVYEIADDGKFVWCDWHDGNHQPQRQAYNMAQLDSAINMEIYSQIITNADKISDSFDRPLEEKSP